MVDINNHILSWLKKHGQVTTADLVNRTGLSRAYIHRMLKALVDEEKLVRVGKANQSRYVPAGGKITATLLPTRVRKIVVNRSLAEDRILSQIKTESSIFQGLKTPVASIVDYAFTEMLNNAIEHSASEKIDITLAKTPSEIDFTVSDRGVGIFKNIMKKKKLASTIEAIQDLLKGKETTMPEAHSGEGIFFTSKVADRLTIRSFEKKIVFDNIGRDIYVRDIRPVAGTRVDFMVSLKSSKNISDIFRQYTDDSLEFNKSGVKVKLYSGDVDYVSRSQARRLLVGLEKFKTIEMDFTDVDTVGQAFADEIFRVWKDKHPNIELIPINAVENVEMMITRAKAVDSMVSTFKR